MAALGSSVINKSAKKFAPKAPARRPAGPAASVDTQASTRSSIDRQPQSQTPQPQSLPQTTSSTVTPSRSLLTPGPSQPLVTVASTKASHENDGSVQVHPTGSPSIVRPSSNQERESSIPITSQKTRHSHASPTPELESRRPLDLQQVCEHDSAQQPPDPGDAQGTAAPASSTNGPDLIYSDFTSSHNRYNPSTVNRASYEANGTITPPLSSSRVLQEEIQEPASKRRRVQSPQEQSQAPQCSPVQVNANVPIPTTESNEVRSAPSQGPIVGSASINVAKSKMPRSSVQAKRGQRIQGNGVDGNSGETHTQPARPRKPRQAAKDKTVRGAEGEASGVLAGNAGPAGEPNDSNIVSTKSKRKPRKRKQNQSIEDAAAEIVEDAIQGSSKNPKKRGRKRPVTPEGADTAVVSPSTVKMIELCRDNRIGRKSEREKDLEEMDRAEFLRKKQKELQEVVGQAGSERGPSETVENTVERLGRQREREESVANHVPNTIIVNGQIQLDESSLQIDRHAEAAAERDAEEAEVIEETELTHKVNSGTWLKHDRSGGWNGQLTERFYDGLRMFGTDFEMLSKMFPGRTRHKIKLKFVREEKLNHDKIKATLLGEKIPIDLPELEKMAGLEFDDPGDLEKDMEEDRKRLEEETLAEKQAMEEARREREEQIAAERAAVGGEESSAKENRRGKTKKKKKKKKKGEKSRDGKGPSKRKEKHASRAATSGGEAVLLELGEPSGIR